MITQRRGGLGVEGGRGESEQARASERHRERETADLASENESESESEFLLGTMLHNRGKHIARF